MYTKNNLDVCSQWLWKQTIELWVHMRIFPNPVWPEVLKDFSLSYYKGHGVKFDGSNINASFAGILLRFSGTDIVMSRGTEMEPVQ